MKENPLANHHFMDSSYVIAQYEIGKFKLTKTESIVLYYQLRGYSARQIAQVRTRSVRTVEKHMVNIRIKLGVRTKSDLVILANQLHLQKFIVDGVTPP